MYNHSNIELGAHSIKIRYKDKCTKCKFFVVLCDGPALLGMPDIELLGMLKIMCEVVED